MSKKEKDWHGDVPPPYSKEKQGGVETATTSSHHDDASKEVKPASRISFFQLFRYADGLDIFLMIVGVILAVAQGAGIPLAMYYLYSNIINALISYSPCFENVRKVMELIVEAQHNGTMALLPPKALAFMNSSQFDQIKNYKSLHTGPGYSLFGEVGPMCGYYALVGLGMLIAGSLHIACWTCAGQRQIGRIKAKLFRAMLSKDASWFDSRRTGELNNILFEMIRKMEDGMTSKVSITLSWIGVCVVAFVMAFIKNWLVTIVIFSLVPLLFVVSFIMIRFVRMYSAKQTKSYGLAGAIANEVLGNSRTVLSFNKQEYEVGRYSKNLAFSQHMGKIKTLSSGVAQGFAFVIINCIAGLAFWWGNSDQVSEAGGNVMMIIICTMLGTTSLANAAPNFENIAAALSGADEVYRIIDEASLIDNFSETGGRIEKIDGEVGFQDVSFAYPSRPERSVLKSLSITVKRGQTMALVGPSGCGKSTTVQLLMRYYDAIGGKVTIDGVDIRSLNVRWLRRNIGLVSQEPVLFNTTIKDNIRLGALDQGEVSDQAIIEACKLSNAHGFISALPQGYDTMVGERGAQLSGGQKQRIAIARALISNPRILVLDEATSALDTTSEKVVQDALDNARVGRTTLVIAHRLSTIRNADAICVLDAGQIVELGNHDTLMELGGLYSRLVKTQEVEADKEKEKKADEEDEEEIVEEVDEVNVENVDVTLKTVPSKTSLRKAKSANRMSGGNVQVDAESGVIKAASKPKKPSRIQLIKLVLGWGRPEMHLTIVCAIVSAICAAFQPAFAILMSEFLGSFCPGDTKSKFDMLIGLIIGIGAIQAIMLTIQHYLYSAIIERLTTRIRGRLLGKLLRMDAAWLDRQENQPSVLTTILATDCIDIQGLSGVRISIYLTTIVALGIAIIYSLILEYRVALALMGLMPLIMISTIFYVRMIMGNKREEDSDASATKTTSIIAMDALANMRTVMALGAEPYFLERFTKQHDGIQKTAIRKGILSGPLLSFTMSSILFAGAITFCLGSWLMERKETEFVKVIRVFALITFSGMSVGRASNAVPDEDKATRAAIKLKSIFGEKPTIDVEDENGDSVAAKQLAASPILANKGTGRIEFKNVTFSYPTRPSVQVLKGISFTIEPGQRVALCGPSGGGKSTIMQLVQRLYDPNGGSVLIDGVDIKEANIRAARGNIGLVAQEPVLFALPVGENISYGSKVASQPPTEAEIESACRQANALEFLQRLPEGMKTEVGERGAQLSGGQKQRIAIARALVRNPQILLLDEATSALDTESERVVQAALDSAAEGRTTLTIAHRLSTIQHSDKILVLANGTVIEQGTHAELMALHGVYYDLQQAQNKRTGHHS